MKPFSFCLLATGVAVASCLETDRVCLSQESNSSSIVSRQSAVDAARTKGPYELSFSDFDWQPSESKSVPNGSMMFEERIPTQLAIEMFAKRSERNSNDYASRTILGELYLRQAVEDDNLPAYALAMRSLREALRINPNYKSATLGLVKVLMAQHQFSDALSTLGQVATAESQIPAELALLADCYLDMGSLDKASHVLDRLSQLEKSPPIDARFARLAELRGDREAAIALVRSALETVKRGSAEESEWHWYQWRLAGLLLDSGDLEEAESLVKHILDDKRDDERSIILLARIAFAKGRPDLAIELLDPIVKSKPSPPSVSLLGDLYCHQKDMAKATECWAKAEVIIREEAQTAMAAHAREAAVFFADHDRHLDEAMDLILIDQKQRSDLTTKDAYVWILYKNKRMDEAKAASTELLKEYPSDLPALYHATKIDESRGDLQNAKKHLQKVIDLNPKFSVRYAADISDLQQKWNLTRNR